MEVTVAVTHNNACKGSIFYHMVMLAAIPFRPKSACIRPHPPVKQIDTSQNSYLRNEVSELHHSPGAPAPGEMLYYKVFKETSVLQIALITNM